MVLERYQRIVYPIVLNIQLNLSLCIFISHISGPNDDKIVQLDEMVILGKTLKPD